MSDEILKDLNRVIEKYKDKVFCTGELNYVDMAKSCKLEIERLNNKIHDISETLNETYNDRTELRNENNRLNNIINELEKWAEGYIFADIFKDKIKELKENKK